jgi:4-hydroxy-tetrahydrodipicolinate reductase
MAEEILKIALIGYGKMGRAIEKIAISRGHEICARHETQPSSAEEMNGAHVAIEFSVPAAAVSNIEACFKLNVPVVVGTTGWYDQYDRLAKIAKTEQKGLFTATNFSLGVNLFFRINRIMASWMNKYPDYQTSMEEIHHIHKLDAPSGTAITLAEHLLAELDQIKKWKLTENEEDTCSANELPIYSSREGEVPGTHIVRYEGPADLIELKHEAKNREGFALGAVMAAEFMKGKSGVYGMNDLLGF